MIAMLLGELLGGFDGETTTLMCFGVGYKVHVHKRLKGELVRRLHTTQLLFISSVTNESGTRLFGFEEQHEVDCFDRLIKLDGVGPSIALRILGEHSVETLRAIIDARDAGALRAVSGVGPKLVERILGAKL